MRIHKLSLWLGLLAVADTYARVVAIEERIVEERYVTVNKRVDSAAISRITASIASIQSAAVYAPSSLQPYFSTLPSSLLAVITDPAVVSSQVLVFASSVPAWYSQLPPAAKSYVLAMPSKAAVVAAQLSSLYSELAVLQTQGVSIVKATVTVYVAANTSDKFVPVSTAGTNGTISSNSTKGTLTDTSDSSSSSSTQFQDTTTAAAETTSKTLSETTSSSTAAAKSSTAGGARETSAAYAIAAGALGALGFAIAL